MKNLFKTFVEISERHLIGTIEKSTIIHFYKNLIHMQNQRSIDTNHVNKMVEYQNNYYKKYNEYFFPNPIIIGILENKYYILDGQHRLRTIKQLTHDCKISCSLVKTNNQEELNEYLKLINTNKPYVQVKNDSIKKIENYLLTNYKTYSKNTNEPRIPNFNSNNIVKILNDEYKDTVIDSDLFIEHFEKLNTFIQIKYKNMKISETHYKLCVNRNKDKPFYVGCIPYNRWIYAIFSSMSGIDFINIDFSLYPYKTKRISIPKKLKERLWEKYNKELLKGECYICKSEIKNTDFDCGHVVPVHKGGKNNIDNLRCLCRMCNNDMGSKNLYTYKKEYIDSK